MGLTAVLITCSYRNKEFIRVGYYVYNTYDDPNLIENPPEVVNISKVVRSIISDKPRITKFAINWTDDESGTLEADTNEMYKQERFAMLKNAPK